MAKFTKVKDGRGAPIRGLWRYGDKFFVQIRKPGQSPRKVVLPGATTMGEAKEMAERMRHEHKDNPFKTIGKTASFGEFVEEYFTSADFTSKKENTQKKERFHLNGWIAHMGVVEIGKLKPSIVDDYINKRRGKVKGRTCNIDITILNNVLNRVKKVHRAIDILPTEFYRRMPEMPPKRQLLTMGEINQLINFALQRPNGQQLADFIRLGYSCGAREQEMLKLRWDQNVDWRRKVLLVGSEDDAGNVDTKNREMRHVQLNGALEAHLNDMYSRRRDDGWLFPSTARGYSKERATTLRKILGNTIRAIALSQLARIQMMKMGYKVPRQIAPEALWEFGFHDLRHHFISVSVMSGVGFMTIASWVGHKDGGILIGKVYGHLADSYKQEMAKKLNFGVTEQPQNVVNL